MDMIEIKKLTKEYAANRGIFDLDFSIRQGEVFGFLGPNGAGKTTTIRHLMGFIRPDSGSCSLNGMDCFEKRAEIQKKLGYIPGEINFFENMNGLGFLNFCLSYRGIESKTLMNSLLQRFEFDARIKLKKMSKGMKQKIGIVAAFMHDPDVLILDEPTSGLDPRMQNRFIELILEEKARGKTILMSSHLFDEVERTCHRVCIIREGRIAAIDSVEALKAAQIKKYIVTLENETAAADFAQESLTVESIFHNNVTVTVQNDMKEFLAAMNRHLVVNLSAPGQSLEEIFLKYYGGNK